MSMEPWNTGVPRHEDMPRKSIDIKPTDYPVVWKKGQLRPFPAFRRGRVRAEPENESRNWSLVGSEVTHQGLKSQISAIFKVRASLFFRLSFYRLLDTTFYLLSFRAICI